MTARKAKAHGSRWALAGVMLAAAAGAAVAGGGPAVPDGVIVVRSHHDVRTTLDRLERILEAKGITVALRWDHAARAKGVGLDLRPTALLVFGNPKLGTRIMQGAQSAGIDMPLRALAWRDADGRVWLGVTDPAWIARRHGATGAGETVARMRAAVERFAREAAAP